MGLEGGWADEKGEGEVLWGLEGMKGVDEGCGRVGGEERENG